MTIALGSGASGDFSATNDKVSSTSVTVTPSVGASVDEVIVLAVAFDNISTTDTQSSDVTSVTDSQGNTWTRLAEYTNTVGGAAADGAAVSVWRCKVTTALTTTDTYTIWFSAATTAKGIASKRFTVAAGNDLRVAGSVQVRSDDAAAPGSLTISGLSSKEYLFISAHGGEGVGPGASWVPSTNYTGWTTGGQTTGSPGTSNIHVRAEHRIYTGTGDTTDQGCTAVDHATLMVALEEYTPSAAWYPPAGQLALAAAATGFSGGTTTSDPVVEQTVTPVSASGTSIAATWPATTTSGNTCIAVLSKRYAGNAPAAQNNAEGGTDGATVTQGATGNTGGASGTYFDIVTEGAGNTLQFQNSPTVKDTLAYEMASPAATQNYLEWDVAARIGATQNQMYARWYVRTPSTPTALHRIYRVRGGLPSLNQLLLVRVNYSGGGATRRFELLDSASSVQWTSTANEPLDATYRIEVWWSQTQARVQVFTTPESTTAAEDSGVVSGTFGTEPAAYISFGSTSSTAFGTTLMDDLAISPDGWIGPTAGGAAPTPPSGWTLRHSYGTTSPGIYIYDVQNASPRSGAETFTWTGTSDAVLHMYEVSGLATSQAVDRTASASGSGSAMTSGTTATTTQPREWWLAATVNTHNTAQTLDAADAAAGWAAISSATSTNATVADRVTSGTYDRKATTSGAAEVSVSLATARAWSGAVITYKAADSDAGLAPPAGALAAAATAPTLRIDQIVQPPTRVGYVDPGPYAPGTRSYITGQRATWTATTTLADGQNLGNAINANGLDRRYIIPSGATVYVTANITITGGDVYLCSSGVGKAYIVGQGATNMLTGSGFWELENIDISGGYSDGTAVDMGRAIKPNGGCRVTNCRIHDNDNQGIGSGGGTIYAQDTVFERNGHHPFHNSDGSNRSAAAIKRGSGGHLVAENCMARDNGWVGFWSDTQPDTRFDIHYCSSLGNWGKGYSYENSGEGTGYCNITYCVIQGNNTHLQTTGGGVTANGSWNMLIDHNVFGGNLNGTGGYRAINILQAKGSAENITISNNVRNGDAIEGCELSGVTCFNNVDSGPVTGETYPLSPGVIGVTASGPGFTLASSDPYQATAGAIWVGQAEDSMPTFEITVPPIEVPTIILEGFGVVRDRTQTVTVSWTVDDHPVIADWSAATMTAPGGFDQTTLRIPASSFPSSSGQSSIVRGVRSDGGVLWEGKIVSPPKRNDDVYIVKAAGPRSVVDKRAARIPWQLRAKAWTPEYEEPFEFDFSELPSGERYHGFVIHTPGYPLRRIAFTYRRSDRTGSGQVRLYSVNEYGPDAVATAIDTITATHGQAIDYEIAEGERAEILRIFASGSWSEGDLTARPRQLVWHNEAPFAVRLVDFRANGFTLTDGDSSDAVVRWVADQCRYASDEVSASSMSPMPLDWQGPWADLLNELALMDGWTWVVEETPAGHEGYGSLRFGPWGRADGSGAWRARLDSGADEDLTLLPLYNQVTTYIEGGMSITHHVRDFADLDDPFWLTGDVVEWPEPWDFDWVDASSELPVKVNYRTLQRITTQRVQGSVTVWRLPDRRHPYDIRAGDMLHLPDFDPAIGAQRVLGVTYHPDGVVTCQLGDDAVSDIERFAERRRRRRNARRRRRRRRKHRR